MAINIHRDQTLGRPLDPASGRGQPIDARLRGFIEQSTIMLFVKGTPAQPRCGFSATVMDIFNRIGAPYATFNVLEDPEVRQGVKGFSSWPTLPQVYIDGEFVGGCDIAIEMFQQGELQEAVEAAIASSGPGPLHAGGEEATGEQESAGGEAAGGEAASVIEVPASAKAKGEGAASVRQLGPRKAKLMGLERFVIIDVRNPEELEHSRLEGSHLIPLGELERRHTEIPRDANLLMQCRSGGRSHRAGEFLVAKGYRHVWNLDGGINAWAEEVDPDMSTY